MFRKIFTALLCVLMLAGVSSAYTDQYGNDGLEWDTAYVIMTSADMNTLAQNAENGRYYKLSADLTLTTVPDWARSNSNYHNFNGHFDGQGHTITYSNVSGMHCLFYSMQVPDASEEPVLRNLNVRGEITTEDSANANYVGGIIRELNSGIVENCTFTGTIRTRAQTAGGIVANFDGGTIKNCTVSGTFRANQNVGAIIGEAGYNYNDPLVMENCTVNSGTKVSSSGNNNARAGGLVGYLYIQDGTSMTGCVSKAQLSEAGYKGGLIGYAENAYRYVDNQRLLNLAGITGNQYTAERAIGNLEDPVNGNSRISDGGDNSGNTGDNGGEGTNNNTDTGNNNTDGGNNNTDGGNNNTDGGNNNTDNTDNTGGGNTGDNTGNTDTDGGKTTSDDNLPPKTGTNTDTGNTSSDDKKSEDSGSGGCSASAGTLMLLAVLALKLRKH